MSQNFQKVQLRARHHSTQLRNYANCNSLLSQLTTQTPSTSQISTMRTESWSSFHSRYQSSRPNAADVTSPPSSRKSLGGRVVGSIASVVSGRRRQNPLQKSNSDLSSRTIYSLHDIECDMGMNFPSTSSRTISQSRSIRFEWMHWHDNWMTHIARWLDDMLTAKSQALEVALNVERREKELYRWCKTQWRSQPKSLVA